MDGQLLVLGSWICKSHSQVRQILGCTWREVVQLLCGPQAFPICRVTRGRIDCDSKMGDRTFTGREVPLEISGALFCAVFLNLT